MEQRLRVLANEEVAPGIFRMDFECDNSEEAYPGQFMHIAVDGVFLRRPFGISSVQKHEISIHYRIVGTGTKNLSRLAPGSELKILLPLGKGFTLVRGCERLLLVGGGMGIAPLLFAAQRFSARVTCFAALGFTCVREVFAVECFEEKCNCIGVTTDDGSAFEKGLVTNTVEQFVKEFHPNQIMACGPMPMLKSLKSLNAGIPTQVSLEERMGCGVGACLTCSCRTQAGDEYSYKRVCADGPVFELSEVVLDD